MRKVLIAFILLIAVGLYADLADKITDMLINEQFTECEELYSKEMSEVLLPGRLESVWHSLIESTGTFEKLVDKKSDKREEFTAYTITLKFENVYMDLLLTISNDEKLSGIYFKPSQHTTNFEIPPYTDAKAMIEEDVEFDCQGYMIKGTITIPKNMRSFPIIIMATGSGPNDRDETLASNKPFRDLAYGLASQGVATFRYDKRTKNYPIIVKEIPGFNIDDEYLTEVNAAFDFISKKWKGRNIYFLGHSMGAFVAPKIMTSDKAFQGAIMLAANARPTEDLVLEQVQYIMDIKGKVDKADLALIKAQLKEVKKITSLDVEIAEPLLLGLSKEYWYSLNSYDQIAVAEEVEKPILVLQGERDYQVTMTDFNLWKKYYDGEDNWDFKSYPTLNHLFIAGQGPSQPSEYMKAGFVAEDVINDIARWVNELEK